MNGAGAKAPGCVADRGKKLRLQPSLMGGASECDNRNYPHRLP